MMNTNIVITVFLACIIQAVSAEWSYNVNPADLGVDTWKDNYEMCTDANQRQSPIDIKLSDVKFSEGYEGMTVKHGVLKPIEVQNTGEHVKVVFNKDDKVELQGGRTNDGVYLVKEFHFHWGSDSKQGAEHLIDGKAYPLEMHMVSYDSKTYASGREAKEGEGNAFAVLGVFFEISESDNPYLADLIHDIEYIVEPHSKREATWMKDVSELLPKNMERFYTYDGGFTTPPCSPLVLWTVLNTTNTISESQMERFRALKEGGTEEEVALVNNYRPPQPLNGRTIWSSFLPSEDPGYSHDNSAGQISNSHLISLFCVACTLLFKWF